MKYSPCKKCSKHGTKEFPNCIDTCELISKLQLHLIKKYRIGEDIDIFDEGRYDLILPKRRQKMRFPILVNLNSDKFFNIDKFDKIIYNKGNFKLLNDRKIYK